MKYYYVYYKCISKERINLGMLNVKVEKGDILLSNIFLYLKERYPGTPHVTFFAEITEEQDTDMREYAKQQL